MFDPNKRTTIEKMQELLNNAYGRIEDMDTITIAKELHRTERLIGELWLLRCAFSQKMGCVYEPGVSLPPRSR